MYVTSSGQRKIDVGNVSINFRTFDFVHLIDFINFINFIIFYGTFVNPVHLWTHQSSNLVLCVCVYTPGDMNVL